MFVVEGGNATFTMSKTCIYYLHPLLAGKIDMWGGQFDRIAAMGFDTVGIAPPFLSGASGDLFRIGDHERLDPRLGAGDAGLALARLAEEAGSRRLGLTLDVVVDQVAAEACAPRWPLSLVWHRHG